MVASHFIDDAAKRCRRGRPLSPRCQTWSCDLCLCSGPASREGASPTPQNPPHTHAPVLCERSVRARGQGLLAVWRLRPIDLPWLRRLIAFWRQRPIDSAQSASERQCRPTAHSPPRRADLRRISCYRATLCVGGALRAALEAKRRCAGSPLQASFLALPPSRVRDSSAQGWVPVLCL